jgi:hypothetical protein
MRELPLGPDLLTTAREVLLNELLPQLPETHGLAARMVANAIGIAAREAAQDPSWQQEALARMRSLTGDAADPLRGFAAAIRVGAFDPGTPHHADAVELLRDITRARCTVSAPRALAKG